jgi:HEAT repeat protein
LEPLLQAEQDDQARIEYAFSIMALTPPDRSSSLIAFTYDEDFYIKGRACELLGERKFEPAIDRLAEIAAEKIPNAPYAAKRALLKIGTPRALQAAQR